MNNALKDYIKLCQSRTENALEHRLPSADILPRKLHEAMRYTVLNGGKRMRPLLTYCTGQVLAFRLKHSTPRRVLLSSFMFIP